MLEYFQTTFRHPESNPAWQKIRPLLSGLLQSERALPIIDGLKYTYKMKQSKEEIRNAQPQRTSVDLFLFRMF
ncbi:hypothetical protein HMPREF9418_2126 [Neisseria macacae ATCC 33926]|uniref:Uncharacterized protein n=1 Tax=Neisseria macacae ATCC 33926 TaxID=997348 RepID=A0AA36UIQ1_9NEIS|nr:hypothetical protein HMPREF9418_2126 [Neisseria macacae ATCC 33926]